MAANKSRESAKLRERKAELRAKINDQKAELEQSKAEDKSLTASSCGRVRTVSLQKTAKGVINTAAASVADGTIPPIDSGTIEADAYGILSPYVNGTSDGAVFGPSTGTATLTFPALRTFNI
ncbi:hypothetical protein B0H16DRAFT_1718489 [Mycena metata]|uniref:Uncharacterized protein n=1 Tax=Mycena metata TaxID=1033252 RepID=A0AAD7JJL0_9AGAR|nr:hypothetical protein B0H16DRAFT_1718489 [Mycena metata]